MAGALLAEVERERSLRESAKYPILVVGSTGGGNTSVKGHLGWEAVISYFRHPSEGRDDELGGDGCCRSIAASLPCGETDDAYGHRQCSKNFLQRHLFVQHESADQCSE